MRTGILLTMLGRQAGGLESYESGLLRALAAIDRENEYDVFCLSQQSFDAVALQRENFRVHLLRPAVRWISLPAVVPIEVLRCRSEVLHATFIQPPVCLVPSVFTVHDLGMFTNPEFYHASLRWRMNQLIRTGIRRAQVVLCISRCVRDLVRERFGVPDEKLLTVYHGVSERFRPQSPAEIDRVRSKYGLSEPYMVFVGQLRAGIKNLTRLVRAHHEYRMNVKQSAQLVLAGRRPHPRRYPSENFDEVLRRFGGDSVRELGYVSDEDLPGLYAGARMLVFPSLCEGFGFPVLEAMACGTPVMASNIATLGEVSGGAALLVDPTSVKDLAAGMSALDSDEQLRGGLRTRGLARAAEFTWRRTAEQTLAAYKLAAQTAPQRLRSSALAKG